MSADPVARRGKVDLVATDLDGTLWSAAKGLHPATREALAELAQRGIPVLAATGRRPRSARHAFEEHDVELPAVLLDGTLGEDFAAAERFHEHFFAPSTAEIVHGIFADHDVSPCVYVDDDEVDLYLGPTPSTSPAHVEFVAAWAETVDLATIVTTASILAFTIIGSTPERMTPVAEAVNRLGVAEATVTIDSVYGGVSLSVIPTGVTKWTGVEAYCRHAGIDSARVLAIGDADNDLGMLRAAAVSCAVSSGSDAARAAARHQIPPPDEGGWAALLDLLE